MKIKMMIPIILTAVLLCGCGDRESSTSDTSSAINNSASAIPDDVRQRLQAALDAEPITIPAEEWTAETLCQAVCINGKPITDPCTLRDLGDGFEYIEEGEYPMALNESNHRATATITYYGIEIGTAVVYDCYSKESFFDCPIYYLFWSFDKFYDSGISPMTVNGLGIHADPEMRSERLYFMDEYENKEIDFYRYTMEIDDMLIKYEYKNNDLISTMIRLKQFEK